MAQCLGRLVQQDTFGRVTHHELCSVWLRNIHCGKSDTCHLDCSYTLAGRAPICVDDFVHCHCHWTTPRIHSTKVSLGWDKFTFLHFMTISSGAQESQELVLLIPGPYGLGPVDFEVNYFFYLFWSLADCFHLVRECYLPDFDMVSSDTTGYDMCHRWSPCGLCLRQLSFQLAFQPQWWM